MNFFKVIKTCFDKGDIVACISGDEFAIITYKEDITKPILVMILLINHYEDTIMSNLHFSYGVKELTHAHDQYACLLLYLNKHKYVYNVSNHIVISRGI